MDPNSEIEDLLCDIEELEKELILYTNANANAVFCDRDRDFLKLWIAANLGMCIYSIWISRTRSFPMNGCVSDISYAHRLLAIIYTATLLPIISGDSL